MYYVEILHYIKYFILPVCILYVSHIDTSTASDRFSYFFYAADLLGLYFNLRLIHFGTEQKIK